VKRYTFVVDATSVVGNQTYYADADSEEEALEAVKRGDGVFVDEELEVQDLGTYQLCDVEDIPDSSQQPNTQKSE